MPGSSPAEKAGTWKFTALRECGFEPVGQVMGCAVHHLDPSRPRYTCRDVILPVEYRPRRPGPGPHVLVYDDRELFRRAGARRTTLRRLAAECTALGGDGVVAVEVGGGPFPGMEHTVVLEAIGTAVRARGKVRPRRPFLSHLRGRDFTTLIASGWTPVALVVGVVAGVRHDDRRTARSARRLAGAREIEGWTELMSATRRAARSGLREQAARTGADGVLVSHADLRLRECDFTPRPDHVVEVPTFGTAVARFRTAHKPARPLTIMRIEET
jgi:uncharacterized protein YbjQ (UPF0145 family)